MQAQRVVPDRPPPGPVPGALLGVVAGLLLASIWWYGDQEVAFAVSAVFAGLLAALYAGAPTWRPFTTGLVAGAAAVGGVLLAMA